MTYGFLPQCLYGTNTSPVGDIIYKKPYEDRRMQKKKNLYKKSKYYRQRQKKIRQICMAAGGVLLLVVLILIVRGCAGKAKSVNSSNVNNATDEKTTDSALSSDSEKNDSSLPMELSRLPNLPATAQIHLLIPKAAILFQQNRSTTPQSPLL